MKKFLLTIMLCLSGSLGMFAEEWTDENGVTWSFWLETYEETTGAALTGMTGNTKDVVIPDYVKLDDTDYPVISLTGSGNLFFGRDDVETIKFPSTLKYMGVWCSRVPDEYGNWFSGGLFLNRNLKSVDVNNFKGEIAAYSFQSCTSLQEIKNSSSCTSIGGQAFYGCTSLTSIDLSSCIKIGNEAFYQCSLLQEVDNLSSCTSINPNAFSQCSALQTIDISFCTSIGNYAFSGCTSLKEVGDLSSCTSIGMGAFNGCSSLQGSLDLTKCETIGDMGAFVGCRVLHDVTIGSNTKIGSDSFDSNLPVFVPSDIYESYKSKYPQLMILAIGSKIDWDITTIVEENNSGIQTAIGEDKLGNVVFLKVTGDINAYDIFVLRNKMLNLRILDLSDANIVRTEDGYYYYGTCTTEDNVMPAYGFYQQDKLTDVKLPKSITSIGACAFRDCSSLSGTLTIPEGVNSIENFAFDNCWNLQELVISEGVTYIGNNAFCNLSNLKEISFPRSLLKIDYGAFQGLYSLKELHLPSKLREIGGYCFGSCSNLTELVLPPSLTNIGDAAFQGCSNLKTVKASAIDPNSVPIFDNTFANNVYDYATLYVPYDQETGWDATYWAYYWNTQWGQFVNIAKWTPNYENIVLDADYDLDKGTIPGESIDAEFGPRAGFKVGEEAEQDLDGVHIKGGGSIIADGNLDINTLVSEINVEANRWYFFCFPFDVKIADIVSPGQSAWRYYNSEKRANNGFGAWTNVPNDAEYLTAGQGYIYRTNKDGVLSLTITKPDFNADDKSPELNSYASADAQNASWNFVGNPYLSYYNIDNLVEFDAPITVWNGYGYEAVRPGDDDYVLQPYQAFFVQKPVGKNSVNFDKDARETYTESQQHVAEAKAEGFRKINPDRLLVNMTVYKDSMLMDKTRVVFNNQKSMKYEMDCDAAKFVSADCDFQLYSTDDVNTKYAINERPVENGKVNLTIEVKTAGVYTFKAPRMDTPILLVDTQNGVTHDMTEGDYEFMTEAGTFNNRFIMMMKNDATAIEDVNAADGEDATYYNLSGQQMNKASKGVNVRKQGETVKKILNK